MQRWTQVTCMLAVVVSVSCARTADARDRATTTSSESGRAAALDKRTIVFKSGSLALHGVVYVPSGPGPFPAVLWNHGSWGDPMVAFDRLAPTFVSAGWVFFGPFRRGQGLSSGAGPYIGDELDRAARSGPAARDAMAVNLLTGEQLADQLAAYEWLTKEPYVVTTRIAVAGNSFGGIETVLGAERLPYCAAVDAAGGAMTWSKSPSLRDAMIRAARASRAPMLLLQAENDFDLTPSRTLNATMQAAGKMVELQLFPAYGSSHEDGHSFAWRGGDVWGPSVLAFLGQHCSG